VLDGLGFTATDYERPVETLSGGQQSRLMLAKLLLSEPDVMLLDEPSNHLDIAATSWLEDYLVKESGAMLIVSHDRYFLDRVATQIFELTSGGLESYPGNYQAYWRLRQERFEQRLKAWEAQQEYVQKQEEYIRRVHYGQLHKQAESRRKALEKLERVDRPRFVAAPHMHFGEVRRTGDVVLRTESLSKSYDRPLFRNLSFQLERGQRLGIMGANGSGKTTLVRVLMGQESPDQGSVERGHRVEFGYYDQHLRILPEDQSVMDAVWPEQDRTANTQAMRDLLARFGLVGEQVDQPVRSLSGGERSRAALARLVAGGANVLVLDEPTNHLDLWACEALEQALLDFQGTTIVVSHDRYFLNRVAQLLIVLEGDGQVRVVHGNYTTYDEMRLAADEQDSQPKKAENAKPVTPAGHEGNGRTAVSSDTKRTPKRKRRFPYRKIDDLEAEIAAAETRLQELQALLASSELYRDGDRVKETMQAFEQTRSSLQHLYDHWEESVELN
jgi:ATP-binding cassette subfamily F protein 3